MGTVGLFILGAILGGAAGFYLFRNSMQGASWVLGSVAGAIVVGTALVFLADSFEPVDKKMRSRAYKKVALKLLDEIKNLPPVSMAIAGKTAFQIEAFIFEKAKLGWGRLSIDELSAWNRIRLKITQKSPPVCASFWTGKVDMDEYTYQIGELSQKDLKLYMDLIGKSALMEIEGKPPYEKNAKLVQEGFDKIAQSLPPEEQERFNRVQKEGKVTLDADACWMIQKLMEKANDLPDDMKQAVLISLAAY